MTAEEEKILEARKKQFEEKLREELLSGRKTLEIKEKEAEEAIRKNPLAYVAGAFVAGIIFGKLLK